jgi:hypothetical protein
LKPRFFSFAALFFSLILAAPLFAAEIDPKLKQGEELLDGWRIAQAEELAATWLRENSKSTDGLDLDARAKFYQGRYSGLAAIDRALAIDSTEKRRRLGFFHQSTSTSSDAQRYERLRHLPDENGRHSGSTPWRRLKRATRSARTELLERKSPRRSRRTRLQCHLDTRGATSRRPAPWGSASSIS